MAQDSGIEKDINTQLVNYNTKNRSMVYVTPRFNAAITWTLQ